MDNLKYIVNLIVGDWSLDGHNQTSSVTIESNLSKSEIKEAYKAGTAIVGFDLSSKVCIEYEDYKISEEHLSKLEKCGITVELDDGDLNAETFALIYLDIAKLGNPDSEFVIVSSKAAINIGGYGLFSL